MRLLGVAGLPRSGSTLLVNLLAQNPRFYASGTSALLPTLQASRKHLDGSSLFRASRGRDEVAADQSRKAMLRGAIDGWYAAARGRICLDKNRSWPVHIEWLEDVLDEQVRIIAPVRDVAEVLASFEKLNRKHRRIGVPPEERRDRLPWMSVQSRCQQRVLPSHPLGFAWAALHDAVMRGFRDRILFVPFDALTSNPKNELARIYAFLEEEAFVHDPENIEQITQEDDAHHGYDALHEVRSCIEPVAPCASEILGADLAEMYTGSAFEFWKQI